MTDIGIGVEAFNGCDALVHAGFTFAWHPDQHPLNRTPELYGLPVGPTPGDDGPAAC